MLGSATTRLPDPAAKRTLDGFTPFGEESQGLPVRRSPGPAGVEGRVVLDSIPHDWCGAEVYEQITCLACVLGPRPYRYTTGS